MSDALEAVRLHENQLQTAILEFHHEETGSTIGLVSMVHFGLPSFYSEVEDYAAARRESGACVYYEGTGEPSPEEMADASPALQRQSMRLDHSYDFLMDGIGTMMRRGLGLVSQSDALKDRTGWETHDATYLEITEQLGRTAAFRVIALNTFAGAVFSLLPPFLARAMAKDSLKSKILPGEENHERQVVRHNRSQRVLDAIDERRKPEPWRSFVVLWGAGHAEGIGTGLLERDYTHLPKRTRWLPVADLG